MNKDLLLTFFPDPQGNEEYPLHIGSSEAEAFDFPANDLSKLPRFRAPREFQRPNQQSSLPVRSPGNPPAKEQPNQQANRPSDLQLNRERFPPSLATGVALWRALPDEAKRAIVNGSREADLVRIKINTNSSAIADMPWELLSDDEGPAFALRPKYQLVRTIAVRVPRPRRLASERKALIVPSQPLVKAAFPAEQQGQMLEAAMRKVRFTVANSPTGTIRDLTKLLNEVQPHVVHFIGHAAISRGEGCLVFERENGAYSEWLTAGDLAKLLPISTGLICLSTPHSIANYQILGFPRLAQAPLTTSLPTMVVNQFNTSPEADNRFWQAFYSSLTSPEADGDVNEAVRAARLAVDKLSKQDGPRVIKGGEIEKFGNVEWAAFALFVRDGNGIPFQFDSSMQAKSPRETAMEIEAMLRTQNANNLAERIRDQGPAAAKSLRSQFQKQVEAANKISTQFEKDREGKK